MGSCETSGRDIGISGAAVEGLGSCANARRDACLARLGYRVLRLEAAPVMQELEVVLACLKEAVCRAK
jgi:very-short-patch-repair endonuclease